MNEEVHGFANSMVEPLAWPRAAQPPAYNGSGPKAHKNLPALQQRKKKDIAEAGMNEEVHGFANSMVEPIAWPRATQPPAYNGSGPKAHKNVLSQKSDIANAEVRPDVYSAVSKIVNPVPLWRTNVAPKYTYEPWWGEGNPPPRTELEHPPCPVDEGPEAEPDLAKLKAAKIMADEKKKDEALAKAEEAKQDAAIKKAEEEEKKAEDAKKKAEAPADEEKKEEKKEDAKTEEKKADAPAADAKTATKATAAPVAPKAAATAAPAQATAAPANATKTAAKAVAAPAPGKIVKLMTGDLIYDRDNNLWRHEPVFV